MCAKVKRRKGINLKRKKEKKRKSKTFKNEEDVEVKFSSLKS